MELASRREAAPPSAPRTPGPSPFNQRPLPGREATGEDEICGRDLGPGECRSGAGPTPDAEPWLAAKEVLGRYQQSPFRRKEETEAILMFTLRHLGGTSLHLAGHGLVGACRARPAVLGRIAVFTFWFAARGGGESTGTVTWKASYTSSWWPV